MLTRRDDTNSPSTPRWLGDGTGNGLTLDQGSTKPRHQRRRELGLVVAAVAILGGAAVGVIVTSDSGAGADAIATSADAEPPTDVAADLETALAVSEAENGGFVDFVDLELSGVVDEDPGDASGRADGGCTIGALSLRAGQSGDGVVCLQGALADEGFYDGPSDGAFDQDVHNAAADFQQANDLFVDGIVGRETAIELDIWPDEESLITRTPVPPAGATDLWGVDLSPVASAGGDAPPLPENSGSGYRVVYDRAGQRVWAVDENERVVRSWLISGSKYSNEVAGTHKVYSRSEVSTAWNGQAYLPLMIRWLKTDIGAIGFHGIPTKVATGAEYQTTDELGTRLSGGCQRQHNTDAAFLWGFAPVGTPVVVT